MNVAYFTMPVHPPERDYLTILREDREAILLADRLGYTEAYVGEHTTDVAESVTDCAVFLASLAHETRNIRLCTGTVNLPNSHPAAVAAKIAMLDHLLGGLDHVLASGRNVNVLVLDTEVYSNTGGQMSKATPLGAVAKFAAAGKTVAKKDLALQAIAYGNVYVARVAMGSDPQHTLVAFREAEAYDGPSLVIAYSHCIAHGIEMRNGLDQQYRAVASGYWPLIRYDPMARAAGGNPFLLDSPRPRIPLADYTNRELRYRTLTNSDPAEAERLHGLAEQAVAQRWEVYEEMATRGAQRYPADARKDR